MDEQKRELISTLRQAAKLVAERDEVELDIENQRNRIEDAIRDHCVQEAELAALEDRKTISMFTQASELCIPDMTKDNPICYNPGKLRLGSALLLAGFGMIAAGIVLTVLGFDTFLLIVAGIVVAVVAAKPLEAWKFVVSDSLRFRSLPSVEELLEVYQEADSEIVGMRAADEEIIQQVKQAIDKYCRMYQEFLNVADEHKALINAELDELELGCKPEMAGAVAEVLESGRADTLREAVQIAYADAERKAEQERQAEERRRQREWEEECRRQDAARAADERRFAAEMAAQQRASIEQANRAAQQRAWQAEAAAQRAERTRQSNYTRAQRQYESALSHLANKKMGGNLRDIAYAEANVERAKAEMMKWM